MNISFFLANRIGGKNNASDKMGTTGTRISIVSVAVSIAVIIIAVAVSNGFRSEIWEKTRGLCADIDLTYPGEDIITTKYAVTGDISYRQDIEELPFVESINGVAYTQGIVKAGNDLTGLILKGIDSVYNTGFYSRHMLDGRVPNLYGKSMSNEIMVSGKLAQTLGYKVGDRVTAYFVGEQVRVRNFEITGIFDAGIEQMEKYLAVGDIRHVQRINNWGNGVSGYEIFLNRNNTNMLHKYAGYIDDIIYGHTTENDTAVAVNLLQEKYYMLADWLHLLDLNVLIVLVLMIAVAGFNMVSALLIMLFERIAQIGLLKALGMTTVAVAKVYLAKSAAVVLKGMLFGNTFAILLCILQKEFGIIALNPQNYFVSTVPILLNANSIILMNVVAFAAIMAIMLLPCMFISRISPATTMRVK